MAKLSEECKKMIGEIHPGIIATANKAGKPNLSAKGSFSVLDDEHVMFADVHSPRTMANLKENPQVSVLVLDSQTRKGCRIWGKGEIVDSGPLVDQMTKALSKFNMKANAVVKIKVDEVQEQP